MKLLVVEDDVQLVTELTHTLEKSYIVEVALSGQQGLSLLELCRFNLVVVDLGLPDMSGLKICRELRQRSVPTPILALTGHTELECKLQAFDAGVDDYLIKPFAMPELLARVKALLRRPSEVTSSHILTVGDLHLDLDNQTAERGQVPITLRNKEFHLLAFLMRNAGRVVTRDMILNMVWRTHDEPVPNIVDVYIKYLRDKVDRDFDWKLIKTVHGLGYKLEAPPTLTKSRF